MNFASDNITGAAPEILAALQDAGLGIVDLTTREAELEDIFLKLTGRPERDGG